MSDLVQFQIPAQFILERAFPTGAEIALGFERRWLRPNDVVEIALEKMKAGLPITRAEEEIALLLPQDLHRVEDLVSHLQVSGEPVEERQRFWLFINLDWLLHNAHAVEDPYEIIELLYDDFDHPEEIRGLVRYMPPSQNDRDSTIEDRWRTYVERERVRYRERNAQSEH